MNPGRRVMTAPSVAVVVLMSMFTLAGACGTNSGGTRKPATIDSVDETAHLSTAEVRKDPDRIVCRRHRPTGSRLSEKICMTARQWQQASDDSQRMLDKAQRAPKVGNDQ